MPSRKQERIPLFLSGAFLGRVTSSNLSLGILRHVDRVHVTPLVLSCCADFFMFMISALGARAEYLLTSTTGAHVHCTTACSGVGKEHEAANNLGHLAQVERPVSDGAVGDKPRQRAQA